MSVARVGFVLAIAQLLLACKSPTGINPEKELTQSMESEHYVYRFSPGDGVDTVWQEAYTRWLLSALQVTLPQKLEYYNYRDAAQFERILGLPGGGSAYLSNEVGTYRFHTTDSTEDFASVVAVVATQIGYPPSLFSSGIAVAHEMLPPQGVSEPQFKGKPVDDLARTYLEAGQTPPLDGLLTSDDFGKYNGDLTLPVAGSFVRYLIDTSGLDKIKDLFGTASHDDSASQTRKNFQAAFGETIEAAWTAWQADLESGP